MKKIFFTLLALVATMSMNAQVMKIMKGNEVVAVYADVEADNVVFEEMPPQHRGKATRTGSIQVTWYQLWENGPKFARYNVGAQYNSPENYGGYYCWGGSINCDPQGYHTFSFLDKIHDEDDTATQLWGSNWRMPTSTELSGLLTKCTSEWTSVNGVYGWKFTGKGYYSGDSVFFPAAGYFDCNYVYNDNKYGYYWSSTPYVPNAYRLYFYSNNCCVDVCPEFHSGNTYGAWRGYGYSIRPVLNEK